MTSNNIKGLSLWSHAVFFFWFFPSCCFEGRVQRLWYCSPPRKHLCTKIVFFFFFFLHIISFHTVVRLHFLQLRSTSNLSKMIFALRWFFLTYPCLEVQMSLAAVFCVPSCHLNVTEDCLCLTAWLSLHALKCRIKNCYVLCSEISAMLLSGRWWKHLSLSSFQMRELKE